MESAMEVEETTPPDRIPGAMGSEFQRQLQAAEAKTQRLNNAEREKAAAKAAKAVPKLRRLSDNPEVADRQRSYYELLDTARKREYYWCFYKFLSFERRLPRPCVEELLPYIYMTVVRGGP